MRELGQRDAFADLPKKLVDVVGHLGHGDGLLTPGDWMGGGSDEVGGATGGWTAVALDVVQVSEADEGGGTEQTAEPQTFFAERKRAGEHDGGENSEQETRGCLVRMDGMEAAMDEQRKVYGKRVEGERGAAKKEDLSAWAEGIDQDRLSGAVTVRARISTARDEGCEEPHERFQQEVHAGAMIPTQVGKTQAGPGLAPQDRRCW